MQTTAFCAVAGTDEASQGGRVAAGLSINERPINLSLQSLTHNQSVSATDNGSQVEVK